AAGHEVEVFTSSYRGAPDQVVSGIPVHRFRYFPRRWERLTHEEAAPDRMKRSLLYRLMPACFVVAGMIAAWRLCRRQRYDVIHYTTSLAAPTVPRAERRSAAAPFTVLFVGRLVERKGVSHLVDAVSLLLPLPGADVRLVIVGDGPERARIEARIREKRLDGRVAVRGRVSDAELQAAYAAADAFVLPAVVDRRGDTEGLGVVLLEAMNHRVPVIASAIGGITDIVEDGVSGLLVPPGDATALAAALGRLARAPDLAAGLGEAGYRRLRERFSWDAITRRWLEVYAAAARPR